MPQLLSIVMPAYNSAEYIAEAVKSIIGQSFGHWELVVVDDCSTDDTAEIVSSFCTSDRRIRLLRRSSNSGSAFIPRTEAVEASTGRYIVEVDADDYISPDYLAGLSSRIEETDADVVFGNMTFIYPDGNSKTLHTPFDRTAVIDGSHHLKATIDGWDDGCKGAVKRELYLTSARHPEISAEAMSADELLTRIIIMDASKVAFAPPTYFYRLHQSSITQARHPRIFDTLDTDMRLRRLIKSRYPAESEEVRLINNQAAANLWNLLREYATFRFESEAERDRVRTMLSGAYQDADIIGSRRRIGMLRTAALLAGPGTTIVLLKMLAKLGKRQ